MNTIQMSVYRSLTYCYGGFRGVAHKDVGSFAGQLFATREKESGTEDAPQDTKKGHLSDEDIAYLREHYSGELNAVEVVRAVRMVYAMGGMSRMEYCAVWGARMTFGDIDGIPAFPELFSDAELRGGRFASAPASDFRSLDDILDWLDKFRENDPEWELLRIGLANG